MSVIIRLQNLPWTANAADIRQYFLGLSIPEGGVHIVGGQLGDAFIAFSTDEDARQAMASDGGMLKDARVKLFLSSRSEMQKIIEDTRQQHLALQADSNRTFENAVISLLRLDLLLGYNPNNPTPSKWKWAAETEISIALKWVTSSSSTQERRVMLPRQIQGFHKI